MRIHGILHAAFEPMGSIETWATSREHSLAVTRSYDGEDLPSISSFDFLIVMGGPQSSLELEKYPYLAQEIELIKQARDARKIILGICLGAQLIGQAFGAYPERSPEKEVGMFPLTLTGDGKTDRLFQGFPEQFDVTHWHNDMPGLPNGSRVIALSKGCPRQVVCFAPNIYGFQCHFEITKSVAEGLIEKCPGDLKPSQFTQTAEQIIQADYDSVNTKMNTLLDRLSVTGKEATCEKSSV